MREPTTNEDDLALEEAVRLVNESALNPYQPIVVISACPRCGSKFPVQPQNAARAYCLPCRPDARNEKRRLQRKSPVEAIGIQPGRPPGYVDPISPTKTPPENPKKHPEKKPRDEPKKEDPPKKGPLPVRAAEKEKVVLHLSDWNNQDKYYRTNEAIIDQFAQRLRAGSFGDAWDWFTGQVNYGKGKDPTKPIKCLGNPRVSDIEETVFLDYFNIQECLDEWYD